MTFVELEDNSFDEHFQVLERLEAPPIIAAKQILSLPKGFGLVTERDQNSSIMMKLINKNTLRRVTENPLEGLLKRKKKGTNIQTY